MTTNNQIKLTIWKRFPTRLGDIYIDLKIEHFPDTRDDFLHACQIAEKWRNADERNNLFNIEMPH